MRCANLMRHFLLCAAVAGGLVGCATRYSPAPTNFAAKGQVGQIKLINDQLSGEPRMMFSDGITTVTTNYKGWADVVIAKLEERLARQSFSPASQKILKLSVASINCTGHYVPDCIMSVQVDRGDGGRQIYTSPTRTGYPMQSALDKAIEDSVQQIIEDKGVVAYLSI